jgi:guanine deaminase
VIRSQTASAALVHEPDAIVAMADGRIAHFGAARRIRARLPRGTKITSYGRDALMAGFIDCHVEDLHEALSSR